jgi:hypothetical protein
MVNNDRVEPAEPATPEAAAIGRRGERSPRDMALSLAVLLVPIALLLIFYKFVLGGDAPITVDPGPAVQEAQSAAQFPVAVPRDLGKDWHVSSATFRREAGGATLRLGYVDPADNPIQLIESSVAPETLLPAELSSTAKPIGTFRTAQGVWRSYQGRPGEQALVRSEPNRTIIVVGRTAEVNLEALASSLS